MKVKLIDYTLNGIDKIALLTRSTRKGELETPPKKVYSQHNVVSSLPINKEYIDWHLDNKKFMKKLIKVKHFGAFEHVHFTFHISEISRALTHQLVRHRIGMSYLQMSGRHVVPDALDYVTPRTIKGTLDDTLFDTAMNVAYISYQQLLDNKVTKEDARFVLPPAYYTHITITCNVSSLRHFLKLRLAKDAQWEIRKLACKLFDIVYNTYPEMFEDLKDLRDKNER